MMLKTKYYIEILISSWVVAGFFSMFGIVICIMQNEYTLFSLLFSFIIVTFGLGSLMGLDCIGTTNDKDFIDWCKKVN